MAIVKIPTQNQMAVYVEHKLNSLIADHNQDVQLTYYLHKEHSNEEYMEMLKNIDDAVVPDKYSTDELREAFLSDLQHERALIERDMKRANDFQKFLAKRKSELENYPKCTDDLIKQLQEFITKTVNYYHKDLVDSYFDMFVNKISKLCPQDKDYSNTIASVYRSKNSKRAMDIISKFFDTLKCSLITMSMNVKRCESVEFNKMFELLKIEFKKLIEKMHLIIYNFIEKQIDYISDDEEMSDSRTVKIYSETCMSQLNQSLISELPPLLDEEFKYAVEDRVENLQYVWRNQIGYEFIPTQKSITEESRTTIVEVNDKPLIAEVIETSTKISPTINDFLVSLPTEPIEVNKLAEMYNNYMGTSVSARGFGMMKVIKEHFTKNSSVIKGKRITTYQKL